MGLWRCQNEECSEDPQGRLIFDFEANKPVCPKCGAHKGLPEHAFTIVKLEIVHFLVNDKKGPLIGRGARYRVACDPSIGMHGAKTVLQNGSGEPYAITCPKCKKTAEFMAVSEDGGFEGVTPKVIDEPEVEPALK